MIGAQTVKFAISRVDRLRKAAVKARTIGKVPDGWSKSSVDPMGLLAVFDTLHVRQGFVLRAYQYYSEGNGNGFIWAMPAEAEFFEPDQCPREETRFLNPPKPPMALDDFMEAVEGDDSPWSYFSASLFQREAYEFGAMWHGVSWGTHEILGKNPVKAHTKGKGKMGVVSDPQAWKWIEPVPREWRPRAEMTAETVEIVFHSESELGLDAIYRHVDRYKRGTYRCQVESTIIADGPGGFIF